MSATILVVDDDVSVAAAVRSILFMEGYRVLEAYSGQEALDLMRRTTPDLIISDVMMPHMDGYQFYEAVQRIPQWQAIPFIFLTARNSAEAILKGKALGVDDYLTKPMAPDELLAVVRGKLRRLEALRQEWAELERLRRDTIAMLSHEFRTPLSTLKAAADLLLMKDATLSAADVRELHEHLQEGGDRLEELVEEFLHRARTEISGAGDDSKGGRESVASATEPDQSATILLVEDDALLAQRVQAILTAKGYNVLHASHGLEALQVMQQQTPSLIISDIVMPQMDGYQFYDAIQRAPRWRSIPFIFLTIKSAPEDTLKGRMLGVDDYVIKPFEPEELLAVVEGRLRRSAALREGWRELEQIRRDIIATLSHEFRTPLSTLKAAADLLLQGEVALSAADVRELHEHIQKGRDRLEELVEDFLLAARIETGAIRDDYERERRRVDVASLLGSLSPRWRPRAEEAQLTFELDCPLNLPPVEACEEHLQNAIARLLSNAIKFNRPGGMVSLAASADEACVRIVVSDTGMGIAPADHERIFHRFVQLERETFEQQGAGLGLPIARGLIGVNGGTLTVESQPNEGSRFIITLPIQKEQSK
jgi:DNA-binding response OmpR family regulator/anti-sigma regulatory factor (Ser/Thr protein kinase)